MKIGITGGDGFIGWHLHCYLSTLERINEIRIANRDTFSDVKKLEHFVDGIDVIVHLAGVNRADNDILLHGNVQPARQLIDAIQTVSSKPTIVYASSTYAEKADNPYGKGKLAAGDVLTEYASQSGARVINMIVPHVFGEYGKPFYNSGVATFCHQIANGEEMTVNRDGQLELIHVQNLAELFLSAYEDGKEGNYRVNGKSISVGEVVDQLIGLHNEYIVLNRLPDLSDNFTRELFNSLRGAIAYPARQVQQVKHADDRGWLVETVKVGSGGQCFVSTTKPGISRGNHFHRRKVERFFVLQGKASIEIRKLFTNEIIRYELNGETTSYVDMPTLHTHKITNVGDDELITLFWTDEFYDPDNPDTYHEDV